MYINNPMEIEVKSMEIIEEALGKKDWTEEELTVAKRIIHTTGDVSYHEVIHFKDDFISQALAALKKGEKIYVDTNMTYAGVNKRALDKLGVELVSYIADEDIREKAKKDGTTRSYAAIKKAINEGVKCFSIGNAPTALFALLEEVEEKGFEPDFVIGVPVGFVGARESKEELEKFEIPQVTIQGNKGGSNVAASIINALLYMLVER